METSDNGSPSGGDITVEYDYCPKSSSRCIEFDADSGLNASIEREADLSGADSATLEFDYRLDEDEAEYKLEISGNGGASWTTLAVYDDEEVVFGESFDISQFISQQTRIRFRLTDDDEDDAHLYIDNVVIAASAGGVGGGYDPLATALTSRVSWVAAVANLLVPTPGLPPAPRCTRYGCSTTTGVVWCRTCWQLSTGSCRTPLPTTFEWSTCH